MDRFGNIRKIVKIHFQSPIGLVRNPSVAEHALAMLKESPEPLVGADRIQRLRGQFDQLEFRFGSVGCGSLDRRLDLASITEGLGIERLFDQIL